MKTSIKLILASSAALALAACAAEAPAEADPVDGTGNPIDPMAPVAEEPMMMEEAPAEEEAAIE